jgi:hypothetical protein
VLHYYRGASRDALLQAVVRLTASPKGAPLPHPFSLQLARQVHLSGGKR